MKRVCLLLLVCVLSVTRIAADESIIPMCYNMLGLWNVALNTHNSKAMESMYARVAEYYKTHMLPSEITRSHVKFFSNYPRFEQYYTNVRVEYENGCQAKLTFDKYVRTSPDQSYKCYHSYLCFESDFNGGVKITTESDEVTDRNVAKRVYPLANVNNFMPVSRLFCESNVGKKINVSYWGLLEFGTGDVGPVAEMIMTVTGFARSSICGVLKRNFQNRPNTYYVGGYAAGGECSWPVIYVYDSWTRRVSCVGGEGEDYVL